MQNLSQHHNTAGQRCLIALIAAAIGLSSGCVNQQPPENPAPVIEKIAVNGSDYEIAARSEASDSNRVKLLLDGPETFNEMFDAIAAATDHVNLETFILADDTIGNRLADALIERAQAGIIVNVIYDALGSGMTSAEFFDRVREGGVNLLEYNPVLDEKPWDVSTRNHRKVLVIDGKTGFTGGLNFTDNYRYSSDNPPPGSDGEAWRDTHIRIDGPAVSELQRAFLRTWVQHADEVRIEKADYFPDIEPAGDQSILVVTAEGGDQQASPIFEHYIQAVRDAEQRVWVVQAYFIPSDELLDELAAAARRGVDVRLILPRRTDNGLTVPATRSYYSRLLEAGVRIYEYVNTHLHAKTALVDDGWATVGSSNLDMLSYKFNHELNAIILDQGFNQQLAASFQDDIAESEEITPERWADRGLWSRAKELLARTLKPIL